MEKEEYNLKITNLRRFKAYADKYMPCFISAFHEKYSLEDNLKRQERLGEQLRVINLGWITLKGHWQKKARLGILDDKTETFVVLNTFLDYTKFIQCMIEARREYNQDAIMIVVPSFNNYRTTGRPVPQVKDIWGNVLLSCHVYCYNKLDYNKPEDKGVLLTAKTSATEDFTYFTSEREHPFFTLKKNHSKIKENTTKYDPSSLGFEESSFEMADWGIKEHTYTSLSRNKRYLGACFDFQKFFKKSFPEIIGKGSKIEAKPN